VKAFPLGSITLLQSAGLLRQAGEWCGENARVQIPQLPRLLQVVQDISRTPAGSRVRETYRSIHLWGDDELSSRMLPPAGAAALYLACRREAAALLELGYPRSAGIDFVTDLPSPGRNPVRPTAQSRSAMHHLGGDMALFMEMIARPIQGHPALKLVFSVWPREGRVPVPWMGGEEPFSLLLASTGGGVPAVVSISPQLRGYSLLCCYDLAGRLESGMGVERSCRSFALFSSGLGEYDAHSDAPPRT
jgi:hypothetical protein